MRQFIILYALCSILDNVTGAVRAFCVRFRNINANAIMQAETKKNITLIQDCFYAQT